MEVEHRLHCTETDMECQTVNHSPTCKMRLWKLEVNMDEDESVDEADHVDMGLH